MLFLFRFHTAKIHIFFDISSFFQTSYGKPPFDGYICLCTLIFDPSLFTFFNNVRLKFIYIKKSSYLCISFENNKTTRNQ